MALIPILPINITPRSAVKWGEASVFGRNINETLWLEVDCTFRLDSDTERTTLAAMREFSSPSWVTYSLPSGYQLRLIGELQHNFLTRTMSKTSAKFEATLLGTNAFLPTPAPATVPTWLRCNVPTTYTSQSLPTRNVQRFASNRSRLTDRTTGTLKNAGITLQELSQARFFEFLRWWSQGLNFGVNPFSLTINGVGSSCRILNWKANKNELFNLSLDLRVS